MCTPVRQPNPTGSPEKGTNVRSLIKGAGWQHKSTTGWKIELKKTAKVSSLFETVIERCEMASVPKWV